MKQGFLSVAIDELIAKGNTGSGFPCGVASIKSKLATADAEALDNLLFNTKIAVPSIVKLLRENDLIVGESTLRKHRRKECRCAK